MLKYGIIESYVHHNKQVAAIVEIRCESAICTRTSDLSNLGRHLCMQLVCNPKTASIQELCEQEDIRSTDGSTINDLINAFKLVLKEKIEIIKFRVFEIQNLDAPIVQGTE